MSLQQYIANSDITTVSKARLYSEMPGSGDSACYKHNSLYLLPSQYVLNPSGIKITSL